MLVIRYCWFVKVFQRCHKGLEFTTGPPLKTFIFSLQKHIVVSCFSMVRVNLKKSLFQIAFLSQKTSKWSIFTIGQILKSLLCMRNIHNSWLNMWHLPKLPHIRRFASKRMLISVNAIYVYWVHLKTRTLVFKRYLFTQYPYHNQTRNMCSSIIYWDICKRS